MPEGVKNPEPDYDGPALVATAKERVADDIEHMRRSVLSGKAAAAVGAFAAALGIGGYIVLG